MVGNSSSTTPNANLKKLGTVSVIQELCLLDWLFHDSLPDQRGLDGAGIGGIRP